MNWLTSIAASDGVGLNSEQLTTTQSMSVDLRLAAASASLTAENITISASSRAKAIEGTGGEACMASGKYVWSPNPPFITILS